MASINDLDTQEAATLFSTPRLCEDIGDWIPEKQQPNTWATSCGVLNPDGSSAGLLVELIFRVSGKTGTVRYKFGVFKRNAWGLERAYQLDIEKFAKRITLHDLPHEHFGKDRIEGSSEWATWTFEQALRHFCERTKITFIPPLTDPHQGFELRMQS